MHQHAVLRLRFPARPNRLMILATLAILAAVAPASAQPDLQITTVFCQSSVGGGRVSNVTVGNGGSQASLGTSLEYGVINGITGVRTSRIVTVPPLAPGGTFTPAVSVISNHAGCCYGDITPPVGETNTANNYRQSSVTTIQPFPGLYLLDIAVFNPFTVDLALELAVNPGTVPAGWSVSVVPIVVVPALQNPSTCDPDGPQCEEPVIGGVEIVTVEISVTEGDLAELPNIEITGLAMNAPEYGEYGTWSWSFGVPDLKIDQIFCTDNDQGGRDSYCTVKNVGTAASTEFTKLEYGVVRDGKKAYRVVDVEPLAPGQVFLPIADDVSSNFVGCCYGTVDPVDGETNTGNNHGQISGTTVASPVNASVNFVVYNPFDQDLTLELGITEGTVPDSWVASAPALVTVPALMSPTIDDGEQYTIDPLMGGATTFDLEVEAPCGGEGDIEVTGLAIAPVELEGWGTWSFNAIVTSDFVAADLNCDGQVGAGDLAQLLAAWGPCDGCSQDLDGDGNVGASDLAILLAAWG